MALDEPAVQGGCMTRSEVTGYPQIALDLDHVLLDSVDDFKALRLHIRDPTLATATVGVSVDLDGELWRRRVSMDGCEEQGRYR